MKATFQAVALSAGGAPADKLGEDGSRDKGQHEGSQTEVMGHAPARDQEQLKRSFISIFMEHPVITLLVVLLIGAVVFGDY
jgi:hypothetical protein